MVRWGTTGNRTMACGFIWLSSQVPTCRRQRSETHNTIPRPGPSRSGSYRAAIAMTIRTLPRQPTQLSERRPRKAASSMNSSGTTTATVAWHDAGSRVGLSRLLVLLHGHLVRGRFPTEDTAAAKQMRLVEFAGDNFLQAGAGDVSLDLPRLIVEPPQRADLLFASKPGFLHSGFQHADRLVIDLERNRERVPVLAATRQRETARIRKTARRALHAFGD